jgi:Fe-S cluster biogenesis protein NfuA
MLNSTMTEPTLTDDALETDAVEAGAEADSAAAPTAEVEVDMEALLETIEYIRPALQADGGDLVLLGVDGGAINLQMVGACGGCPMSMMTLKAGIERIMFDRVAGVTEVNAI